MFRGMRRKKQILTEEEAKEVLNRGTSGVLALLGDDDYPYAVPISYVYCDSKLYFHGTKTGHKIDAIKNYDKASFCVIDKEWKPLCMMEFSIEHLYGKEAIELVNISL